MIELTDTHRRAALRGRESVARSHIAGAVWAGRVFAILFAALTVLPLIFGRDDAWADAILYSVLCIAVLYVTSRLSTGSKPAAISLLTLYVATKLADWLLLQQPLYNGLLWTVILVGAFCNGVWGTFALSAVKRDSALVPHAPPRGHARATGNITG